MKRLIGACACVLLASAPLSSAAERTVIRGGTLLNPDGSLLENAVIVIDDGVIRAVGGPDTEVPYDATEIDATGRILFPGMVLAHTTAGLDRPNESLPVTPFVDVYDAIDPVAVSFEDALRDGTTTLHVIQGNDTVIGGMSRIVRPVGAMVEDMTVRPEGGLKMSIAPKRGLSRMAQMYTLRKAFEDLDQHVLDVAEKRYEEEQKKAGKKVLVGPKEAQQEGLKLLVVEDLDSKWRTLYRLKNGQVPVYLYCESAADVHRGIEFVESKGLLGKTVFVAGPETFKAADAIKATGRPVILDGNLVHTERDPLTGDETETFVPKVFADQGIPFALQTFSGSMGEQYLWYQAARLVREGIARDVALKAITQTAADALGLGDQVGAIAPGRHGNVLLLSGDPLAQATFVDKVVLEGRLVYERDKDRRLQELLTGKEIPPGEKAAEPAEPPAEKAAEEPAKTGEPPADEKPKGDGPAPKKDGERSGRGGGQGGI